VQQSSVAAGPATPSVQPKTIAPSVLALDLRTLTGPRSPESAPASATHSSSPVRSSKKEKRSTREKSTRKRPISSVDDRESDDVRESKCRKTSTPPTSPRASGAAEGKSTPPGSPRMIKSPRAAARTSATGLPPRKSSTASPPASPRGAVADAAGNAVSPRPSRQVQPGSPGRAASWVSPVQKERSGLPASSGMTLSPRRGSIAGSGLARVRSGSAAVVDANSGAPAPDSGGSPKYRPATPPTHDDNEFVFQDFDAGMRAHSALRAHFMDTDETQDLDPSTPISIVMISAELAAARTAFQEAAAPYRFSTGSADMPVPGSGPKGGVHGTLGLQTPAQQVFEQAYIHLLAGLAVADFTFRLADPRAVEAQLREVLDAIEACRRPIDGPAKATEESRISLKNALDSLASACNAGLDNLADEFGLKTEPESMRSENSDTPVTASAASPTASVGAPTAAVTTFGTTSTSSGTTPARLPFTLSTESFLDDLSSLMDEEIVVSLPATPAPEKPEKKARD
jgi:hypothetical protein